MTTQDKKTALNAISQAIDEDIENIIEGKEIVIPETEDTCFRQEQVYTNLMSRYQLERQKVLLDENCCCFIAILNIEYSILGIF